MNNLEKAEKIILEKIHTTNPHLKYAIRDLLEDIPPKEIAERYSLTIEGVRNLKCRYKTYLEEYKDND